MTGSEAAEFLGVKRETLYAYASRGLVVSEPGTSGRGRRYRREDLERLKANSDARAGHGPVAAGALRWGEPVLSSALTSIDTVGPRYRGHAAVELAETSTFEAVAELLWTGALPEEVPAWSASGLGLRTGNLAAMLPETAHPLSTLALAVPAIAAGDPGRFDAGERDEQQRARALLRRMAALLGFARDGGAEAAREAIKEGTIARALLVSLGGRVSGRAARLVDRALVLIADHELNASSFTVRVAASVRADLYACVAAGIATASGPLHGASPDRVEAMVAEIGNFARAREVLEARARRGDGIPGFGHPLYPDGDPRLPPLLAAAEELAPRSPQLATLRAILDAMRVMRREPPNVDFGLAAVSIALGLPPGSAAALFVMGRAAGWVAHALEQRAAGFILRPRARYVGPAPV